MLDDKTDLESKKVSAVERMEGDFFTVMGLPMHKLSKALSQAIRSLEI